MCGLANSSLERFSVGSLYDREINNEMLSVTKQFVNIAKLSLLGRF